MAEPKVEIIRMMRSEPQHKDGPVTADVHPDEVQNYQDGGWVIDNRQPEETPEPKIKKK